MSYIKLDRRIKEWGWFKDRNTLCLWVYLLVSANYKRSEFMGEEILPGELATSLQHLADDTGLTINQVRTSLQKLRQTGEIITMRKCHFTKISIVKWADYQLDITLTSHSHHNDITLTSQQYKNRRSKEYKNNIDTLPVYDPSSNEDMDEEEANELLTMMGRA